MTRAAYMHCALPKPGMHRATLVWVCCKLPLSQTPTSCENWTRIPFSKSIMHVEIEITTKEILVEKSCQGPQSTPAHVCNNGNE